MWSQATGHNSKATEPFAKHRTTCTHSNTNTETHTDTEIHTHGLDTAHQRNVCTLSNT